MEPLETVGLTDDRGGMYLFTQVGVLTGALNMLPYVNGEVAQLMLAEGTTTCPHRGTLPNCMIKRENCSKGYSTYCAPER